eukprot:5118284-Pleurochrysis_carterae.AAC.2
MCALAQQQQQQHYAIIADAAPAVAHRLTLRADAFLRIVMYIYTQTCASRPHPRMLSARLPCSARACALLRLHHATLPSRGINTPTKGYALQHCAGAAN